MCFYPIQGYKARRLNPTGKRSVVFNPAFGFRDMPIKVACGRCTDCRLKRSRDWSIRMMHEASLHKDNCFITLTFRPADLAKYAPHGSLDVTVFQRFMKRLRKYFNFTIRFFHCGEYGERTGRPHYHAIVFGLDFPDKVLYRERDGIKLYTSAILLKIWTHGHVSVGEATFDSAAYVARYIMKKVNGSDAFDHYFTGDINTVTGELFTRKPEYTTMSRRPGIGNAWYEKYRDDVFSKDAVLFKGMEMKPPKYYDGLYELDEPTLMQRIKILRSRLALKFAANNTTDRLIIREKCQKARLKLLVRNLDKDSDS